jgi:hypothetical protein
MDLTQAVNRIEELLVEEREAIRRLDSERVANAAAEKEALLAQLAGAPSAERTHVAPRLRGLIPALRHNGVLLAHARDCVRDALIVLGQSPPPEDLNARDLAHPNASLARPGQRISVTG